MYIGKYWYWTLIVKTVKCECTHNKYIKIANDFARGWDLGAKDFVCSGYDIPVIKIALIFTWHLGNNAGFPSDSILFETFYEIPNNFPKNVSLFYYWNYSKHFICKTGRKNEQIFSYITHIFCIVLNCCRTLFFYTH